MSKNVTRRHMLKFVGGSAAGFLLTPIPWKTLDDLAIWTQNGPWIAKPPRGEVQTRFSTCTLCPAACGVRARCVGSQPVSLSGTPAHPLSRGTLCPIGLGGHHLSYHPARLLQPVRINRGDDAEPVPVSVDAALSALVSAAAETRTNPKQKLAILDQVPGRTMSRLYRALLGAVGGLYLTGEADRLRSGLLADTLGEGWRSAGLDLAHTATLLSFGAPLLDGWGTPGRIAALSGTRDGSGERKLRIIQVEPRRSRTACAADLWLPIKPGTEATLALGLAHVLLRDQLIDEASVRAAASDFERPDGSSFKDLVRRYTPERVSQITTIAADSITALARELAQRSPAVVIGGADPAAGPLGAEEERAICALNLLLGSFGRTGGIVLRQEAPEDPAFPAEAMAETTRIEDIQDGSIRLLILDSARCGSALPWGLLEKKLAPQNGLVVAISPVLAGDALRAHLVIPAPAYLETLEETVTPPDSPVCSFGVSQALRQPPAGVLEPAQVVAKVASALSVKLIPVGGENPLPACLQRKADAIHSSGRGSVFSAQDGKTTEMSAIESADSLWKLLNEGGCWTDAMPELKAPKGCSFLGRGGEGFERLAAAAEGRLRATDDSRSTYPFVLMPSGVRGALDDVSISPLMTKLYQESGLMRMVNQADINPETARALGLPDRAGALVETQSGNVRVEIRYDPGVMPGVVHVALGPSGPISKDGPRDRQNALGICQNGTDAVWRAVRAKVREA